MSDRDVEQLKRSVDKILLLLNSDDSTRRMGVVEKLDKLSNDFNTFVTKYEQTQAVKKATIGAWATIGGVVALVAKYLVTFVFEHLKF